MSLCVGLSDSDLIQTRWEELQPIADEPRVVYSWMKAKSSPECSLYQLVEDEIRAGGGGDFEEQISTLMFVSWRVCRFPDSPNDRSGDSLSYSSIYFA